MIGVRKELGIAVITPEGEYDQVELGAALERLSALFPSGPARGLILDFTRARGLERRSVVQVRETARLVALHGARFGWRTAVVGPVPSIAAATDVAATDVAAVVTHTFGVAYRVCRDFAEARAWLDGPTGRDARATVPASG